ncbi:MAG: hypothetical protein ACRDPR_04940 [Nocardioidaceae bacterium]
MRRVLAAVLTGVLVAVGAGVAVAGSEPTLVAHGPTRVEGTDASAVFRIGGRTIRQVRYDDRGTLVYSFSLANEGRIPVTVKALVPPVREPRLFRMRGISDGAGGSEFTIPPGQRRTVRVSMLMLGCESLSARAGSFATEVRMRTERAGMLEDVVTVTFPEEVHTGSPREASCPRATATSRPPG